MADRRTRDALLRLRRVNEIGSQRQLLDAREALGRAEVSSQRAETRATAAKEKLAAARADGSPRNAGQLAARERFLERLRENAQRARERARAAHQALGEAEAQLQAAQLGVETALRAREAAESQAAALEGRRLRQKARREESANDDRWRRRK